MNREMDVIIFTVFVVVLGGWLPEGLWLAGATEQGDRNGRFHA